MAYILASLAYKMEQVFTMVRAPHQPRNPPSKVNFMEKNLGFKDFGR